MATDIENLKTVKSNVIARLADITARPKPSYSIDGQSVSWTEYQSMLTKQLADLNLLIQASEPYCVVSRGRS